MKCNRKGHQGGNEPGTSEEHVPEYCFSEGCVPDACALTIFAGEHHCTFTQIDRMILFSRQKQTQTLPEKTELVSYENIKHKVIKHTIWSASYTDSLPTPSRSQCNASPLFHKSYVEEQFRYMNCPAMASRSRNRALVVVPVNYVSENYVLGGAFGNFRDCFWTLSRPQTGGPFWHPNFGH